MRVIGLLALAVTCSAMAQNAKVVKLTDADAAEAKRVYAAQEAANKAVADFQEHIKEAYVGKISIIMPSFAWVTICPQSGPCDPQKKVSPSVPKPENYQFKDDWIGGFEFSDDFRYIVPAPIPQGLKNEACKPFWISPAAGSVAN